METRTAGSASGLGKRVGSNPDTAPQADSTGPSSVGNFGSMGPWQPSQFQDCGYLLGLDRAPPVGDVATQLVE